MSEVISRLFVVLACAGWMGCARADLIGSDDIVSVDGREWAQVDLFINQSWNDMSAKCPFGGMRAGEFTFASGTWELPDGCGLVSRTLMRCLMYTFQRQG